MILWKSQLKLFKEQSNYNKWKDKYYLKMLHFIIVKLHKLFKILASKSKQAILLELLERVAQAKAQF